MFVWTLHDAIFVFLLCLAALLLVLAWATYWTQQLIRWLTNVIRNLIRRIRSVWANLGRRYNYVWSN